MKFFKVDARTLLTLGRDSIRDHKTALLELVKNSYDADASKVMVEIFGSKGNKYIRVADNGCGMSEEDVEKLWLRIGYSEKRHEKITKRSRRKTGEKGIGRISADRLGEVLFLKTKAKGKNSYGLEISWDDFDVQGKDLSSIPIKEIKDPELELPKRSDSKNVTGTELIIKGVRHVWSVDDVKELYDEFSILTCPFQKVSDFEIHLKSDIVKGLPKKVESPFFDLAEVELNASFDGKKTITYSFKSKFQKTRSQKSQKIDWDKLIVKEE